MRALSRGPLISLAVIAITFLVGVAYLAFGVARFDPLKHQMNLTMHLPQAAGLIPRSPVLLSGVRVGHVTALHNESGRVAVDFNVDSRYRVPGQSTVRIENLSGLGEAYILFLPRTSRGPYLENGQVIDTDQVIAPVSISELAHVTTQLMQQVNPTSVASIVNTFHEGLAGTDQVVTQLSRSTDLLAAVILSRAEEIQRLLINTQAHLDDMDWIGPALNAASVPWAEFGPKVYDLAESIGAVARKGKLPDDYTQGMGLIPFLDRLLAWINKTGPDVKVMAPLMQPMIDTTTRVAGKINVSQQIADALAVTPDDGTLHLQVAVK